MDPSGKIAIVTGAARRVGRAIALRLSEAGAHVIVHYHHSLAEAEQLAGLLRMNEKSCTLIQADLRDAASVVQFADEVSKVGQAEILVNSASVFYATPLGEISVEQWDENLDVNLRAPFLLSQKLGMQMKVNGGGKIINIADSLMNRPYRRYLPYLVSKAALASLTRVLALELAPEVQVNCIAPGTVLMPEEAPGELQDYILRKTPLHRLGSPEDVAELTHYLVTSGDFMTGGIYPVDGGISV
jgi:pteridine reductase